MDPTVCPATTTTTSSNQFPTSSNQLPTTNCPTNQLSTSSNQLLGQTFRPISSNQLIASYFFIHSQHSEKEGRQDRTESKLRYHYQYHHNHPPPLLPPQLLQMKRWGEERREEEPQKTQSHSHSHTHTQKKGREQKLMINVVGWLLPHTRPGHAQFINVRKMASSLGK